MAVYKEKNGTWRVVFRNTTKRGFKSKAEAQQYESKIRLNLDETVVGKKFYDIAEDYISFKEARVAYGTYQKIKRTIEIHIFPNSPNKSISKYTKRDARNFDDYVRSTDLATRSKRFIIKQYKAIFKHSEQFFDNKNNPAAFLDTIKYSDAEIIESVNDSLRVWTVDEFSTFIKEVENENSKLLFNILYFTGLRLGEALALTWADFNKKELSISKSLTKKSKDKAFQIKAPKNKSSIRTINVGNYLNEIILNHFNLEKKKENFNKDWFILGGEKPLSYTTVERHKNNAIKETNLHTIRIHDLRHSHASNLISDGIPITAVSKRLGHSNISITLDTYTHLIKEDNDLLIESINRSTDKITK